MQLLSEKFLERSPRPKFPILRNAGPRLRRPCIDSAMEWPGIFLGSVHGYIKTIFLNNSKILVNRVVWLFRGNLEGLRLGLIPVEQFLTIVPGRAPKASAEYGFFRGHVETFRTRRPPFCSTRQRDNMFELTGGTKTSFSCSYLLAIILKN